MYACTNGDCGLTQLAPVPTADVLQKAYAEYRIHSPSDGGPDVARPARSKWPKKLRRWHRRIAADPSERSQSMMYLDDVPPGSVLEIGCGNGTRAAALASAGWKVEGLELDERSAQFARDRHGLTVHVGGLEGSDLGIDRFDAIVMNHVIEHLTAPIEGMRKIHRALKPGGRFVSITPNAGSWGSSKFGPDWVGIDAPRHLYVFNQKSLERLLSLEFAEVEVFSSTVNSGMHLYASNRMRDPEPYRSGEEQGDERALFRIRNLGIAARLRASMGLGSGEEIVGIARKR